MSKISEFLDGFYSLYIRNRQSGTSSLIQKIELMFKVFVIVKNEEEKRRLFDKDKKNVLTLDNIRQNKFLGMDSKPIIIDIYALETIMENFLDEIKEKDDEIKKLRNSLNESNLKIKKIKNILE